MIKATCNPVTECIQANHNCNFGILPWVHPLAHITLIRVNEISLLYPLNWCCWIVVLRKTLESPLDRKEIKPVNYKGNHSWISIGKTDAIAAFKLQYQVKCLWKRMQAYKAKNTYLLANSRKSLQVPVLCDQTFSTHEIQEKGTQVKWHHEETTRQMQTLLMSVSL